MIAWVVVVLALKLLMNIWGFCMRPWAASMNCHDFMYIMFFAWRLLQLCLYAQFNLVHWSPNLQGMSGCLNMHLSPYWHLGKYLHSSFSLKCANLHCSSVLLQFGHRLHRSLPGSSVPLFFYSPKGLVPYSDGSAGSTGPNLSKRFFLSISACSAESSGSVNDYGSLAW